MKEGLLCGGLREQIMGKKKYDYIKKFNLTETRRVVILFADRWIKCVGSPRDNKW
jgi:hypothetical protein